MALLEVPTGSKNAPNRFPIKFYPKWYVRLPFSQKIFSENRKNRKNLPGRLRNPSRKKNRDLNRISLTLSNRPALVSGAITPVDVQYNTRGDYSFPSPPLPSSKPLYWVRHKTRGHCSVPPRPSPPPNIILSIILVYIGTSMHFGDGPW